MTTGADSSMLPAVFLRKDSTLYQYKVTKLVIYHNLNGNPNHKTDVILHNEDEFHEIVIFQQPAWHNSAMIFYDILLNGLPIEDYQAVQKVDTEPLVEAWLSDKTWNTKAGADIKDLRISKVPLGNVDF